LGAHYAGADSDVCDALARYGNDLGVAFQIADDLLDLTGDEATVGKSLGTYLLKQNATLPLIRLLDMVGSEERKELVSVLSQSEKPRREILRPWFERFAAIPYAREKANDFCRNACGELNILPQTVASQSLLGLTHFVINRHQ